jgi:hypothetical protein
MNSHKQNLGGFFVINLITNRIIKEHKHMNTAIKQAKQLGLSNHVVKPIADREAFYAERKAMGQPVPKDTQRC